MFAPVKPLPAEDLNHVLVHTRELWAEARRQAFFITGGTGFFGIWLLESFARINDALGLGMTATVLTRDHSRFAARAPHLVTRADLCFVEGDVRDFKFPLGRFDYVVHAATEVSARRSDEAVQVMLDGIIRGTQRVLDFAVQASTKKLLLTSSGAVYGAQPSDMTHIPEEYLGAPDPLLPGAAYGEGKRIAEHLCAVHARQHDCEAKIARCFAVVGPHLPLDSHFAVGNFIRDAMRGESIVISGDGTPMRSYIYTSDLAIWLWTILFRAPSGRAYNVGSEIGVTVGELGAMVSAAFSGRPTVSIAQKSGSGTSVSRYVPSVARATTELNLKIDVPLVEAIRRTVAWHSNLNP